MIFQIFWPQKLESNNNLEALPIHTQLNIVPKDLLLNYLKRTIILQKPLAEHA